MKLQWRRTLFTPEFTTWVGLPTHKHYILPFTSAHWLSTKLDFKTISGHWVKIQSINETAGKSLVHNDHYLLSSNRFLSVNTSCEMTHWIGCYKQAHNNGQSGQSEMDVLQTNQLIAVKPNMTGKVTFCVGIYPRRCRRKWNETEFTTQAVHKMFRVRL